MRTVPSTQASMVLSVALYIGGALIRMSGIYMQLHRCFHIVTLACQAQRKCLEADGVALRNSARRAADPSRCQWVFVAGKEARALLPCFCVKQNNECIFFSVIQIQNELDKILVLFKPWFHLSDFHSPRFTKK